MKGKTAERNWLTESWDTRHSNLIQGALRLPSRKAQLIPGPRSRGAKMPLLRGCGRNGRLGFGCLTMATEQVRLGRDVANAMPRDLAGQAAGPGTSTGRVKARRGRCPTELALTAPSSVAAYGPRTGGKDGPRTCLRALRLPCPPSPLH